MLTVACVKWGDRYGPEYVHQLQDAVSRHLSLPHRFVCFTDQPEGLKCETRPLPGDLQGWWNKVYLFKPGLFSGRMLFLDLDVAIVDSLDEVAEWPHPFGIIDDWHLPGVNSSCFVMDADAHPEVWQNFAPGEVTAKMHGDQDWIHAQIPDAPTFPPDWFSSFRSHSRVYPYGKVVVFHGEPKPYDYPAPWVRAVWKTGGATDEEWGEIQKQYGKVPININDACNTANEEICANVRDCIQRPLEWVHSFAPHGKKVAIVGGAPSLKRSLPKIRQLKARGYHIWALNGAYDWLQERGIVADAFVMMDARKDNLKFLQNPHPKTVFFLASQCHPAVFDHMEGYPVVVWHTFGQGVKDILSPIKDRPVGIIGGGGTVGLRSLNLAHTLGHRHLELFGYDSSLSDDEAYAYEQERSSDRVLTVEVAGRRFKTLPTLAKQSEQFHKQFQLLQRNGTRVKVHGDGLIPWVYQQLTNGAKNVVSA